MKIKVNKKIKESSSSGGMVGFSGGIQNVGSHKKEKKVMGQEDQVVEQLMRQYIRKKIRSQLHEQMKKEEQHEHQLRLVIRELIKEAKENANPHPNTGINKLRDSFRKAKATIKSKFQQLTTDPEQRKTFRAHFLNSFEKLYGELDALNAKGLPEEKPPEDEMDLQAPPEDDVDLQAPSEEGSKETPDFSILEEILKEVKVDLQPDEVEEDTPDEQTKKDFVRKKKTDQEKEYYSPDIDDADTTGRNQAFDTFRLVQSYFSDAYLDLDNQDDKIMFKDWCMYNLDLLLKNYEAQLSASPEEPQIKNPEGP